MSVEPVLDNVESTTRVIVQVNTMPSVRLNVRLESTSIGESRADRDIRNGSTGTTGVEAVTTTVNVVVLTSNNECGTSEGRHLGSNGQCEELSECDGLLGHFGEDADAEVEVVGEQEGVDVGREVGPGQVSVGQVLGDWCYGCVPLVDDVPDLGVGDVLPDVEGGEVDADADREIVSIPYAKGRVEKQLLTR